MYARKTSEAEILVRFALRPVVSRYKVAKNWKCTKLPQTELEHLTVKSTQYTLCTYPQRSKISVKSTLYILTTYPKAQIFHPFCSTTSHF